MANRTQHCTFCDLIRGSARVMASPREFTPSGSAGMQFSDYIPHIATCADDLCMIRSMHTDISNHHPAQMMMNCGTNLVGRPSMGSWVTYGLGSESESLPGFVVLTSTSGKGIEGGTVHRLSKGDVISIPAKTPHWWKDTSKSGSVGYYAVNIEQD